MSLRRSSRAKRPSSRAFPDGVEPPARRRGRISDAEAVPEPQTSTPGTAASSEQPSFPPVGVVTQPTPTQLSAESMQNIISAVTSAVTQNMAQMFSHLQPSVLPAPAPVAPTLQLSSTTPDISLTTAVDGDPVSGSMAQAINSVCSNLTGENLPSPRPSQLFQSVGIPLYAKVSDKLKSKIWANEFIDFGSLLNTQVASPHYRLAITNPSSDGVPTLQLEPEAKGPKISTIDTWFSAFHVFVAIYTCKHPSEAPSLMKYGDTIKDLASRGYNWQYYDENFRFLRQSQTLPWGDIHWELWLRSSYLPKKPSSSGAGSSKSGNFMSIPKGYCFRFHKGLTCAGCSFKHTCFKCNKGTHRAVNCNFRPSTANGASATPSNSSANSSQGKKP